MPVVNHISGIYCITNKVNGKVYIGQSRSCTLRWRAHKTLLKGGYHFNKYLQEDYNLYGLDTFEYSILEECPLNKRDEREAHWIKQYTEHYNQVSGGDSRRGCKSIVRPSPSEETRSKISEGLKGNIPWNKDKIGFSVSEETKQKISNSMKGKLKKPGRKNGPPSEETKEKIRQSQLGKVMSEESRHKMSEAAKNRNLRKVSV